MASKPNFSVTKKDHFSSPAGKGGGVRVPTVGTDKQPKQGVQNLTLYHFYRGNNEFLVPTITDPHFPGDYCKVALIALPFSEILKVTSEEDGNWSKLPEVKDTWAWTHYKKCGASGKRGTCVGDVVVEQDGETWKLESKAWSYVGNFPDAVGVPGKS